MREQFSFQEEKDLWNYRSLATIWLSIYEQQYSLMDSAQVMVTKIIWDTAFYWGVFGLLYFHNAFRDIADSPGIAANLTRIAQLSNRIQAFYREWHAIDRSKISNTYVDLYSPLDFMVKLHTSMAAEMPPSKLAAQFAANVRLFERLAGQIISTVIEAYADDFENEDALDQIQHWQTDPYIADLIVQYRREGKDTSTGEWIMVGRREMQEVVG